MAEMPEITVAVESVVYQAIKDVLQAIQDQHGIIVEVVRVSWDTVSVIGSPSRSVVVEIDLDSRKTFSMQLKDDK